MSLFQALSMLGQRVDAPEVEAHCDGPCGVYDPASARIAAEAAYSMTKKILALEVPPTTDKAAFASYLNTVSRYVSIKEEQAHLAKQEVLVLWTDFFKPQHLEQFPDLHNVFWNAAKNCSYVKQEVSMKHAEDMMANMKQIHEIFWKAKGRDVPYYTASGI